MRNAQYCDSFTDSTKTNRVGKISLLQRSVMLNYFSALHFGGKKFHHILSKNLICKKLYDL